MHERPWGLRDSSLFPAIYRRDGLLPGCWHDDGNAGVDTMNLVAALAAGIVFGLGLAISGMADPSKVLAFLTLNSQWDLPFRKSPNKQPDDGSGTDTQNQLDV